MNTIAADLAKTHGVKTLAVAVDITDNKAINAMAETIKDKFGRVDILCNNAGASFGVPNTVLGYDEAAWIKTIDVNLFSVFRVSRALVPLMAGKPAVIVNTASRAGKVPPLFNSAYAVAKAGVIMLTKTMAKELGGNGIRVNAISPGPVRTMAGAGITGARAMGAFQKAHAPLRRMITLDEIGGSALYFLSELSGGVTGEIHLVDAGYNIMLQPRPEDLNGAAAGAD